MVVVGQLLNMMTNPQELLAVWTNLQTKILSLKPLYQNKELIIEALEFHRNQASSWTSIHSHEPLLNRRLLEQEKERLTKELEKLTRQQEAVTNEEQRADIAAEKVATSRKINQLTTTLNDNTVIDNFNRQKAKNEQIVKDCQELLSKLTE